MDEQNLFAKYDPNGDYVISEFTDYDNDVYTKCTKLMYLIIFIKHIPNGKTVIKKYIEDNKETVNEKSDSKWSALLIAAYRSYIPELHSIIKKLIKNGANINEQDNTGYTPLMYLVSNSYQCDTYHIVKLLIERGASTNITSNDGVSSLHLAARTGHNEIIKLLLKLGADVNLKNRRNSTPLFEAARGDNYNAVKTLIENGADIHHTIDGKIFLDYRCENSKYIRPKTKTQDYLKLIFDIEHQKICMKKVAKDIKKFSGRIFLSPIRMKTIELNFYISNGMKYAEAEKNYPEIMRYYSIYDDISLVSKIQNNLAFMD